MRLEETIFVLSELGDGRASLILDITKGQNNPVYWFDTEEDINHGDFYLKRDDLKYSFFGKERKVDVFEYGSLNEFGDLD